MKMKKVVKMPLRRPPPRRPAVAPLRARAATAEETYDEEDYESEEPNMKFSHALIVVLVLHLVAVGGVFAFNWMKARQTAEAKSPKPAAIAESSTPAKSLDTPVAAPTHSVPPSPLEGWTGKTHTVAAGDTLTRIASLHGTTIEALEKENGITTYSMIRVGQVLKVPGSGKAVTTKKTETVPTKSTTDTASKQAFIATKTEAAPIKAAVISAAPKPQATEASTKPTPEKAATTPTAGGDTYTVVKGDNPYTIAKKLEVSYNELMTANDIKDPTKIQIGQKLKVPKKN